MYIRAITGSRGASYLGDTDSDSRTERLRDKKKLHVSESCNTKLTFGTSRIELSRGHCTGLSGLLRDCVLQRLVACV